MLQKQYASEILQSAPFVTGVIRSLWPSVLRFFFRMGLVGLDGRHCVLQQPTHPVLFLKTCSYVMCASVGRFHAFFGAFCGSLRSRCAPWSGSFAPFPFSKL